MVQVLTTTPDFGMMTLALGLAESSGLSVILTLGMVVLTVVLVAMLSFWPYQIAKRREHPQAAAIGICGFLGFFFTGGLLWIVAMVWAHTKPQNASTESIPTDKIQRYQAPQRFELIGVDRQSGFDTRLIIEAHDLEEAKFKGFEKGMEVKGVRRC